MNIVIWFSWYEEILEKFGFSRYDDEESAKLLDKILEVSGALSPTDIPFKHTAVVFGAGPSLKNNIIELKTLKLSNFTIIAADGATTALLEEDIIPDIIVTDLDGKMEDIIRANQDGSFLVVHAHGNNLKKIDKYVPQLKRVLGTTQSTPLKNIHNFGGFTDGDRAVYLAVELGVKCIILAGMDFGKVITKYSRPEIGVAEGKADEIKELKLKYAKKLVEWVAENEDVSIFNISYGEKLEGVQNIGYMELKRFK